MAYTFSSNRTRINFSAKVETRKMDKMDIKWIKMGTSSRSLSSFDDTSFSLDELNRGRAVPAVTPRPVMDVWYLGFGPRRAAEGAGVDSANGLPASSTSLSELLKEEESICGGSFFFFLHGPPTRQTCYPVRKVRPQRMGPSPSVPS
jgi:hypothetical protein